MNLKVSAAASVFFFVTAITAHAADMISDINAAPAPQTSAPYSWTGFYGGVEGGLSSTNLDFNAFILQNALSPKFSGGTLSGYVGYNFQFDNNFVLGIEGDLTSHRNRAPFSDIGVTDFDTRVGGSLRGRVGYAFDRILLYGTAGYAKTKAHYFDQNADAYYNRFSGWTAGAGVEYGVTDHITLRTEYRHTNYGHHDTLSNGFPATSDLKQDILQFGIGYKF